MIAVRCKLRMLNADLWEARAENAIDKRALLAQNAQPGEALSELALLLGRFTGTKVLLLLGD